MLVGTINEIIPFFVLVYLQLDECYSFWKPLLKANACVTSRKFRKHLFLQYI